ncbi:MAG: IclR family transcriptional regulator C-terminal domain-containing protein, partial [Pseudomonadota bacterium]
FHVFTEHTLDSEAALLAELTDIRQNGYGFDREEHEPGIICVAMPILTGSGRVLGALSVTSTTGRTNLAGLEAFVPILKETANKITRDAQNWSFPDYNTKETTGI